MVPGRFLSGLGFLRVYSSEMTMTDSQTMLSLYARTGSEPAFRELVSRYIDLVYSTAFRLVGGDMQSAQDVVQTVFVALADKAGTLPEDVMLGGWLHQHTRFAAGKLMRTERRRQSRERQAAEMNAIEDHTESNLAQVAPVLDEAIGQLDAEDRTAILLRFFERKDFRSVGDALGSSEDAARKRVDRALEKLHILLRHRGATLSAVALGTALATEAVTAAPAGLAGSVAGTALASAAAGGGITATLVKLMTMTKLKFGIISVIAVAGVAAPLAIQYQSQARLREENLVLRQQASQLAQVAAENERLSNLVVQAKSAESLSREQMNELLRLRGEVGHLRRDAQEFVQLKAASSKAQGGASSPPEPSDPERINQMVRWLNQNPSENTPELKLLSAPDWLKAVRGKLDTEDDYRRAASELRGYAEAHQLLPVLYGAVKQYAQAQNGRFPTELSQLKSYFTQPIDDAILLRYQILPAANLSHLINHPELGLGGEWAITQKAPINEVRDSRLIIGLTNFVLSLETNRWVLPH
jgi:RNA polymerase sigma factor (sigma-70 family)